MRDQSAECEMCDWPGLIWMHLGCLVSGTLVSDDTKDKEKVGVGRSSNIDLVLKFNENDYE